MKENLRLSPYPSFPVGLQILNEVLAFWEFSAAFAGFCEMYSTYVWCMVHQVQMPDTEFGVLLGPRKA